MKNKIIAYLTLLVTIVCFIYSSLTIKGFNNTFDLLVKVIVPSLLPFMIVVNFFVLFNGIEVLGYYLQFISRPLFNISGYGCIAILSSIFGGYPYSAIIVGELIRNKKITKKEGQKIINFIFLPSISFLISLLHINSDFASNFKKVVCAIYLTSFIFLFIFKERKEKCTFITYHDFDNNLKKDKDYYQCFNSLISSTLKSIVNISFCIIIFSLLKNYLSLFIKGELFYLFGGVLEFSESSISILRLNSLNYYHYLILTFILAFCSLSVFFQASFYINDASLSLKKLIISRLLIALISLVIFSILYFI